MQIYFLHFNKCGGTSFQHFFRNIAGERQYLYCEHLKHSGDGAYTIPSDAAFDKTFIHDPSGMIMPTYEHSAKPLKITILRDPVSRIRSDWHMVCRWNRADLSDVEKHIYDTAIQGIEAHLKSDYPGSAFFAHNNYAQRLDNEKAKAQWESDIRSGIYKTDAWQNAAAEKALKKLKEFDLICMQEELDDFSATLANSVTGSTHFTKLPRLNVHHSEKIDLPDSPEFRERLAFHTGIDQMLYDWARKNYKDVNKRTYKKYGSLGGSTIMDFHGGFAVDNVYPREVNGDKAAIWTMGGEKSTFSLTAIPNNDYYLTFRASGFASVNQLNETKFFWNGAPLMMRFIPCDNNILIGARIPRKLVKTRNTFAIMAPGFKPSDPNDQRFLGIEIDRLSFIREAS